ncbi:MAG TPA: ABC transporter permease [Vicinamibacterales bacterium]|nr:ABC transporter permease [Vicinamibacterales bacterium]
MISTFLQDLRYAARLMVRAPGFTLVAAATLAIGIGATTAIFSVIDGVLLQPLPYPDAARLVTLWQDMHARGGPAREWATPGNYVDWRAQTDVFSGVFAVRGWPASLTIAGEAPEALRGAEVTPEYFDVLRVPPMLGRGFRPADGVPKAARVVVLSHALWQTHFGSDPHVVGRTILVGGEPHEIVGVMPARFSGPILPRATVWRPLQLNTASPSRGAIVLRAVGRLRPDVTVEQSSAALSTLARRLAQTYPESNTKVGFQIVPLRDQIVGGVRTPLLVLLGAVGFVLLIACVNVASLLLARASRRGREIAVRVALGAPRARVVRQLLTESLLLAAFGGVAGVLLGLWGVSGLVALAPAGVPRLDAVHMNGAVLGFAALLVVVTGIAFGFAPAWQASDVAPALKDGGRGGGMAAGGRTRRVLIVSEVALALMLLVGGGLLLRTFLALQRVDLGFVPDHVMTVTLNTPPKTYQAQPKLIAFYRRVLDEAQGLPGVQTAALSSIVPLNGGDSDTDVEIEGRPAPASPADQPTAWYRLVSATYFDAMGIPLRQGRGFAAGEAAPVVVVNEALARKYWPGANAVGQRLRPGGRAPWFTVVGVVGDVKVRGAQAADRVEVYVPFWQMSEPGSNLVLKMSGDPSLVVKPLKQLVARIDPAVPLAGAATMRDLVAASVDEPRFYALLVGLFGVLALALAAAGIYGVMSYVVAQRTAEIGVRMALGARSGQVFGLVVGDTVKLTLLGIAIGAAGAAALSRSLHRLLFGVPAADPLTFGATGVVLLLVALAASYVPARRAMRIDPIRALRES